MKVLENMLAYSLEGFLMAGAGLSILGLRLEMRKLISIALMYSFFVYSVRHIYFILNIPLGTHAFILMIIFALLTMKVGRVNFITSFIGSLTSVLLIFWGEGVFLFPIIAALNIDPIIFSGSRFGYMILGMLISDSILIVAFVIGYIFNLSLIDLSKERLQINTKE